MFCKKCNKNFSDEDIFCYFCGSKLLPGNSTALKNTKQDSVPGEAPAMNSVRNKIPKKLFIFLGSAFLIILLILVFIFYPRPDITYEVQSMPTIVEPDRDIPVYVKMVNSGRAKGSIPLTLSIDGAEFETKEVSVLPGEEEFTHFNITRYLTPGIYDITVNEWTGKVKVLKPAEYHIENLRITPGQAQVGEEITINAQITNRGEMSGPYTINLWVDGESVLERDFYLSGNSSEPITYTFALEEPGQYAVKLNEHRDNFKVLKPAEIKVTDLTLSASSVRPGQSVSASVELTNSGDVAGDYTASLTVGGRAEQSKTVNVPGNSSQKISFSFSRSSAGRYTVASGGVSKTFTVMQIERPRNGAIISRRMSSGKGRFTIQNGRSQDALVVMTGSGSTAPLLAVYIHANSSTTISDIADRSYDIYFTHGDDWDKGSNQFTRNASHMKSRDSLRFQTTSTQLTTWSITVHAVAGGTMAIDRVSPGSFPTP